MIIIIQNKCKWDIFVDDVPLLASSDCDPRCSHLKLNVSGLLYLDEKGAAATSEGVQVKY